MVGSAALKGVTGVASTIFGQSQAEQQARAKNEEMMRQYKYQLQIRAQKEAQKDVLYSTKLGQYKQGMNAADRAASRAYGIEQYNQAQRLKQAAVQSTAINRALAASGGAAAASGKRGSGLGADQNTIGSVVGSQNMIAQNLLTAEETRDYRELAIQDNLQSQRNRLYSNVAIAPMRSMVPLAPTQVSAPSRLGAALKIAGTVAQTGMDIAGALPENPTE